VKTQRVPFFQPEAAGCVSGRRVRAIDAGWEETGGRLQSSAGASAAHVMKWALR
jgi:hypothetical protein